MKFVYIAHQVSGNVEENIRKALGWYRWALLTQGVIPIAPYIACCQALDDTDKNERRIGMKMDKRILTNVADEVWLTGPTISPGMAEEERLARSLGIPVFDYTGVSNPPLEACGVYL